MLASAAFNSKTTNSIKVTARATDENGDTLTYKLYTSTSKNGSYTQKATTSASQNSTVTLNATGLSQYTTYWWYVQVSDGEETITSSKQSVRTYCPGTGYTCYTSSCSGTRTTTCTTCDGDGDTRNYCSGGSSSRCSYCSGSGTVSSYCSGGYSSSRTCTTCGGSPSCGATSLNRIQFICTSCSATVLACGNCNKCGYQESQSTPAHPGGGGRCSTCGGTGRVTTATQCSHGKTSQHSYCEHGYTVQHD